MHKFTFLPCLSLFFCLSALTSHQDEHEKYFILYVEGEIFNMTQNKSLKSGDFLWSDDQLRFKDKGSKALVISSSKGRFMIQPQGNDTQKESELVSIVNKLLLPVKKNRDLSTRQVGMFSTVMNIEDYFGMDKFYIIGNSLHFKLNTAKYPLNENDFLVLSYNYQGTPLSKRLPFHGDVVSIQKEAVFKTKNGEFIEPDSVEVVKLYQIFRPDTKVYLIEFKLCFIGEEQLKEVYQTLLQTVSEEIPQKTDEKYQYLIDFFVLSFGQTDETVLKDWLIRNNF